MILLPRLYRVDVEAAVEALHSADATPQTAKKVIDDTGLKAHWNRAGGMPASAERLGEFAAGLRELARTHGYPDPLLLEAQQNFDRGACRYLHDSRLLHEAGAETKREACWAGLSILYAPDLVVWRHGRRKDDGLEISSDRFHGGVRNFLRRLWLRSRILRLEKNKDTDPWILVDRLSEDAVVQIIERPSISSDRVLSLAIAAVWLKFSMQGCKMEDIMRLATRKIRAIAEIRMLGCLEPDELRTELEKIFRSASRPCDRHDAAMKHQS